MFSATARYFTLGTISSSLVGKPNEPEGGAGLSHVGRAAGALTWPSPTALPVQSPTGCLGYHPRYRRWRRGVGGVQVGVRVATAPLAARQHTGFCAAKEQIGARVGILVMKKLLAVVVNEVSRAERRCYRVGIHGVLIIAYWQHVMEASGGRADASCSLAMAASAASHRGKTGLGRDQ